LTDKRIHYLGAVPDVLVATDADFVLEEVAAALTSSTTTVRGVHQGVDVLPAVEQHTPDLIVLDLQIGNMGGMAVCLTLRLEEGAGRLPRIPVLMLLDRQADIFLARRAESNGWLVKPLDAIRLRKAAGVALDGGSYAEGELGQYTTPPGELTMFA
jgi:DNA-binding response OmpR family regulator